MTRRRIFAIALAVACAMAPTRPASAAPATAQEELPVPPIPPDQPPGDVAAPVPNADLYAPTPETRSGPSVRATLNDRPPDLPGADPIPGTVYRYDQQQKRQFIPNPGIELVLPLQK